MELSDLQDDLYRFVTPLDEPRIYIYPLGVVQATKQGIVVPSFETINRMYLQSERLVGGYLEKSETNLIFDIDNIPSTITQASEELYRQALANGVIILEKKSDLEKKKSRGP